ncbi:MAG: glycosyltransferase [Sulfuricurvum sp.]|nr:glycosyltransferase [Sulfuricurvum sp.]
MKLCIIASGDYFSSYGGGQVYVKNLVIGLSERGHDLHVVSIRTSPSFDDLSIELMHQDNITIHQITLSSQSIDLNRPYELQPFLLKTLKDVLSEVSPNLVHAHGWKYACANVCYELNIPCVITAHHGGIVCPSGALLNQHDAICNIPASIDNCLKCALHFVPGGDFWSSIVRRLPYIFSQNMAKSLKNIRNIPFISPAFQTPLGISHKLLQLAVLRQTAVSIIAPSHAIAETLYRNTVPRERVHVIPHGITPLTKKPLESFTPKRQLHLGYIGRISYVKGLHVLIDALNLLPNNGNYELHIYGDAATKDEKRYARKLKEKSQNLPIIWHGKIANDQIEHAYHSFDIMVHPTICLEIFGLTLLESLSAGRPVIATRCGGPEDFVQDGIDGILVEPNDAQSLSRALQKCILHPEYVQKLSSTIRSINTLENHINEIEKVYQSKGQIND